MKEIIKKFADATIVAMGESTVMQGLITVGVTGVWLYMILTGKPIDDTLKYTVGIVTGFYFGSKSMQQLRATMRNIRGEKPL